MIFWAFNKIYLFLLKCSNLATQMLIKFMKKVLHILFLALFLVGCSEDNGKEPEEILKSADKQITAFSVNAHQGTIDEAGKKITLNLPAGTNVTALTPVIAISEKATVSPASGASGNFTQPVTYTVTAEDGSSVVYTVTVNVSQPGDAKITEFFFSGITPTVYAAINESTKTIIAMVPFGTNVTALSPTISVSAGANVNPASGVAKDFTNHVAYTVTPSGGSPATYTVTVIVLEELRSEAKITAFSFPTLMVDATINEAAKTITATVPSGTDVTALAPTINVSGGATITPASGIAKDFTHPVQYVVKAENNSTATYTVTVTKGLSNAAKITAFSLSAFDPEIIATIDETAKTITATVPFGTDVTALVPTITLSAGATVSPLSGAAQNFTGPVQYLVTAQNGSTKVTYTATVTVAPFVIKINGITPNPVAPGDRITITGTFAENGNTVVLYNPMTTFVSIPVVSQSATAIVAEIPSTLIDDNYTLRVMGNGKQDEASLEINEVTNPHIVSIEKSNLIQGWDDLVIFGNNLNASDILWFHRVGNETNRLRTTFTLQGTQWDGKIICNANVFNDPFFTPGNYCVWYASEDGNRKTRKMLITIVENTAPTPSILSVLPSNPCPNTDITITGTSFGDDPIVWFFLEEGSYYHIPPIVSKSPTQIVVKAPSAPGTVFKSVQVQSRGKVGDIITTITIRSDC